MPAPLLSFSNNTGPAPVSVATPKPLSLSSTIGDFSSSPGFTNPTGSVGSVPVLGQIPTTAGDFAASTTSGANGLTVPDSVFNQVNSNLGVDSAGNPVSNTGIFGDFFGKDGFNIGDVGNIASVVGGFGNLFMGLQANKLAKKTLDFQKRSFNENLKNQIASFNLALEDRMNARIHQQNGSPEEAQKTIDRHKL